MQKTLKITISICIATLLTSACQQRAFVPPVRATPTAAATAIKPQFTVEELLERAEQRREEEEHEREREAEAKGLEGEGQVENEALEKMARVGREEQYRDMLAYPAKTVPVEARIKGYRLFQAQVAAQAAERTAKGSRLAPEETWQAVGPQKITGELLRSMQVDSSGRVTAILIHPSNPNIVYAGAAQGGVWKTTDGGDTWAPLTDGQASLSIGSMAFDPNNPEVIYVGTGEPHSSDSFSGQGVLKSSNGGASWTNLGNSDFAGMAISDIAVDPNDGNTLYVAVSNRFLNTYDPTTDKKPGIYKSTNGGTSWQLVLSACQNNDTVCAAASALVINPSNANTLYAGLEQVGLFKTTNGGNNWDAIMDANKVGNLFNNGNPVALYRVEIAISASNPQVVYSGFELETNSGSAGYIIKTTDGGANDQNWSLFDPGNGGGYCAEQCSYNNAITIHPTNPDIVFAGGQAQYSNGIDGIDGTLFSSRNGGQSWTFNAGTDVGTTLHPDLHAIAIAPSNPSVMWVGVDGGVYRSTDGGATWQQRNTMLGTAQFQSVALHPTDPNVMFGGMQDNAKAKSTNGGTLWTGLDAGDGGFTAIDPFDPRFWYGTRFSSSGQVMQFQRNDNAGTPDASGWPIKANGININDRVLFYAPLATDPSIAGRVYWGTHLLYRSNNRGDAWSAISPDLTKGASSTRRAAISAIAILPGSQANSNVIAVGTSDGNVQVTTNGGNGWTDVTKAPLPNRYVTDVAFGGGQKIYVSYAGYATNTPAQTGHVFRSDNGGGSWIDISNNLPDLPVWALAVDETTPSTLYVGNDFGIYRSTDSGATWSPFSDGLPRVAIFDMALKQYPNGVKQLVAATHGRSMWRVTLAGNVTPPGNIKQFLPNVLRDFIRTPPPTGTPGPSPTVAPSVTPVPSLTPTPTKPAAATPTPSPTSDGSPTHTPTPTPTTGNPTQTPTQAPGNCPDIDNCDFEKGRNGDWTEFSANNYAIIGQESAAQISAHSGQWLGWLGGSDNEVAVLAQGVNIPQSRPFVKLAYWIGSDETECTDNFTVYDVAYIKLDDTVIGSTPLCQAANTGGWVVEALNATAFAGQSAQLSVVVYTDGSLNSNLFVDDFSFVAGTANTTTGRFGKKNVPDVTKSIVKQGKATAVPRQP